MTEVFIDASALLRYLLNDVPKQADQVEGLFDKAEACELRLVTNSHVMAELVGMLSSGYKVSRTLIRQQLESLIHTPGISVVDGRLLLAALKDFEENNVDFSDAYAVAWMKARGVGELASFDQDEKGFSGLQP